MMYVCFWPHDNETVDTVEVEVIQSRITTGSLHSLIYLGAGDAQRLLNAMWHVGMRPTNAKPSDLPRHEFTVRGKPKN
jgi:hypothetical protein